jgi:hypothetical protein
MVKINMNELAKEITLAEGKKVNLSIAQVKEVLKITLDILDDYYPSEVLDLIERVGGEK